MLAIIAYKQPVTRVEIDDLRGVKSEGPIHTLISRGLIMEMGRSEGTGRAILYGTTELFLDRFGLESIEGLPPLTVEEDENDGNTDLFMTQFQEAFGVENDGGGNDYLKRAIALILFVSIVLFTGGKEASARDAWVVIDAETGRLLSGSNEHVRLPIASLTKIWTAFTVLESGAPLGITTISLRLHPLKDRLSI